MLTVRRLLCWCRLFPVKILEFSTCILYWEILQTPQSDITMPKRIVHLAKSSFNYCKRKEKTKNVWDHIWHRMSKSTACSILYVFFVYTLHYQLYEIQLGYGHRYNKYATWLFVISNRTRVCYNVNQNTFLNIIMHRFRMVFFIVLHYTIFINDKYVLNWLHALKNLH